MSAHAGGITSLRCRGQKKQARNSAAVGECKEKREPAAFSGHRKADCSSTSANTNVIKLRIVENELSKRRLIFVFMVLTKCEKCAARFRCFKDLEMRKRAL